MGILDFIFPAKKKEEERPISPIKPVPASPESKVPPRITSIDMSSHRARIKFRGVFDLNGLYQTMFNWFESKQFTFHETLYKAKAPELELEWFGHRRESGYIRDHIYVYLHLFGIEVETVKKGVKKRLMKGRMTIDFWPVVETDYPSLTHERKWNTIFQRKLQKFYHDFIIRRELDLEHTDSLYYEMYQLHDVVKNYLELEGKGYTY